MRRSAPASTPRPPHCSPSRTARSSRTSETTSPPPAAASKASSWTRAPSTTSARSGWKADRNVLSFLLRRLAFMLFTLWLVSAVTFGITQLLPGDVASAILGQQATPEDLATLRAEMGLDRPVVVRYAEWLGGAV